MKRVTLQSAGGTAVFGQGGLILHRLQIGAPALRAGQPGARTVELEGYILPTGAAEGEREAFLSRMRSRIVRICAAADGFVLTYGEESLRLKSTRAPHFSTEAPLNGTDAAFFTLAAESEADGSFWGKEQVILCRGVSGGAVFPMALHAETVFALLSRSGETEIHNPGDLECPFTAEITAEDGELSSVRLMLDEAYIAVNTPLREGEILTVHTHPGQKGIFRDGIPVLSDADWRSEFFSLPAGESLLCWQTEGSGRPRMRLRFTPRYL